MLLTVDKNTLSAPRRQDRKENPSFTNLARFAPRPCSGWWV